MVVVRADHRSIVIYRNFIRENVLHTKLRVFLLILIKKPHIPYVFSLLLSLSALVAHILIALKQISSPENYTGLARIKTDSDHQTYNIFLLFVKR